MAFRGISICRDMWAFSRGGGGSNPLIPSTNFWRWIFRELGGDEGTPPYFEGAQFIVFVACSWSVGVDKSKRGTTRDHPRRISQKYRALPYPNSYIFEKPFARLFRKGTIHPPSATPCSVKSTDPI